ncbi:MAG: DNA primase [Oscillospiraceae bacterium]|nr:DNA primase [Oscillospiraceae bacterium]
MALSAMFISELLERTSLLSLVSAHTQMRQKGGRWVGLCPFHAEKTPSFMLSPDERFYRCFGCNESGDAISFLRARENMDFMDAVRYLAGMAGMEVPEREENAAATLRRARHIELNTLAARWFHENLSKPEGERAALYLAERGLTAKTARKLGLGAAPARKSALTDYLLARGASREELTLSGLSAGGGADFFRDRLMFPLLDTGGNVAGFSGRRLDGGNRGKYINSPETAVYRKSRFVYGLNIAKNSKRPYFVLTEGNMDVATLLQHGIDSAVAPCGTALTQWQASALAKYKQEVVLAGDTDEPGRKAAERNMDILAAAGLRVRVPELTGAKDPDEYLRRYGPGAFEALLSGARRFMEYRLSQAAAACDMQSPSGRRDYLKSAERLLLTLSSEAERQVYSATVAAAAGVTTDAVLRDLTFALKRSKKKQAESEARGAAYPKERPHKAEDLALYHILSAPEYAQMAAGMGLGAAFAPGAHKELYEYAVSGGALSPAAMPKAAGQAYMDILFSRPEPAELSDEAFRGACALLLRRASRASKPQDDESLMALRERVNENKRYGG